MKQLIRRWLGIEEPQEPKDWTLEIEKLTNLVKDTRRFAEMFCEIICTGCGKTILTYPFGGGYYREADGSALCSKECLNKHAAKKAGSGV